MRILPNTQENAGPPPLPFCRCLSAEKLAAASVEGTAGFMAVSLNSSFVFGFCVHEVVKLLYYKLGCTLEIDSAGREDISLSNGCSQPRASVWGGAGGKRGTASPLGRVNMSTNRSYKNV